MKIAFIYSDEKLSSKLTQFFTGSKCYHVAWVNDAETKMWDMNLTRRVRRWPHYDEKNVILIDSPVSISEDYMNDMLMEDVNLYGVWDYTFFALRPIYHFFGKSTKNAKGVICSEMVANDLWNNGWGHVFPEVPSPADLEKALGVKRS